MHWTTLFGAVFGLAAVSAQSTPYRPGVPASPFPSQAANARVKIDADTACETAQNETQPRNVQLAAWVECQVLALYPYPRTEAANDTNWVAGFEAAFHPSLRASFNNTRYNRDGFLQIYKGFSSIIGQNYGTGWQQWRDFYVASPDSDPTSKGGVVTTVGFNGGLLKGQTVPFHAPNAGYFVVKVVDGRRWITEIREQSTLASAVQLPPVGQLWPCDPVYEACN